jgi:hypothetical protein
MKNLRYQSSGFSVLEVLLLTAPLCILSLILTSKLTATSEARMQSLWRAAEKTKRAAARDCHGGVVSESANLAPSPYFFQAGAERLLGKGPTGVNSRSVFLCNEPDRPLHEEGHDPQRWLLLDGLRIDVAAKDAVGGGLAMRSHSGQALQLKAKDYQDAQGADADGVPRPPGVRLFSLEEPEAGYMLIAYQVPGAPAAALSETVERLRAAGLSDDPGSSIGEDGSPSLIYALSGHLSGPDSDGSSGQGREVVVSAQPYDGVFGMSLVLYLVRIR